MGFRPLQVSRALAKAAVASVRDGGAVAVEGYAMVPLMPDNIGPISGRSSWLGGLAEHKCAAADTMGAGLQGWKAFTQLAALPFWGSAPVAKPAAANCSNKRAIWRF
jgi:hypothetical protein